MRFTYYGENKEKGFDRMFTVAVRNESEYKSIKYALLKLREDYYKVSDVPELNEDAYWVWAITSDFIENRADAKGMYNSIKYESKLYSDKVKKFEKLDIPFSEKLSSGLDDDFDIYAYDGSMPFEDFKKVQELYTKEAEVENDLIEQLKKENEQLYKECDSFRERLLKDEETIKSQSETISDYMKRNEKLICRNSLLGIKIQQLERKISQLEAEKKENQTF